MVNTKFINDEWNKLLHLVCGFTWDLTKVVEEHHHHFENPDWVGHLERISNNEQMTLPNSYQMYTFYRGQNIYIQQPFRSITDAISSFISEMSDRFDDKDYQDSAFWRYFLNYATKIWYIINNKHNPTTKERINKPTEKSHIINIYDIMASLISEDKYQDYVLTPDKEYKNAVRSGHIRFRVYSLPTENYELNDLNADTSTHVVDDDATSDDEALDMLLENIQEVSL
jgi:hypothetical protein